MNTEQPAIPKLLDTRQVANILGIGADYVRVLCSQKRIGHLKRGRKIFCTTEDVARYMSGVRVEAVEVDQ